MDHSAVSHGDPASPAEGSGTARLPANEGGHTGLHIDAGDDWMVMAHGFAWGVYSDQSGPRGDDKVYGGTENDQLNGGADNDSLYGEDGDDSILGSAGNDYIEGGQGGKRVNVANAGGNTLGEGLLPAGGAGDAHYVLLVHHYLIECRRAAELGVLLRLYHRDLYISAEELPLPGGKGAG